jgi:hypothetical protein
MSRKVGINAYGTEDDRRKLEVLALLSKQSSSAWIIDHIQSQYKDVYGDTKPEDVLNAVPVKRRKA